MQTIKDTIIRENGVLDFNHNSSETFYFSEDRLKSFCRVMHGKKSTIVSFPNCVGVFNINGNTYRIESKINNFSNIFKMFKKIIMSDYVFNTSKKLYMFDSSNIVNLTIGNNFFDLIVEVLLNEINKIKLLGFSKTYSQKRENSNFLKGRLLINHQIRKNIVQDKFYCQFNEMTFETKENLILYTVLHQLIYRELDDNQKSKIIYFTQSVFNDILNIHEELLPISFDYIPNRQNMHYDLAIRLAEIIYHQNGVDSQQYGKGIFCNFAIKMDVLYEQYIFLLIREVLNEQWPEYTITDQFSLHHIENSTRSDEHTKYFLEMFPDIVIFDKEEPLLVIDTKYKDLESKMKLQNNDYYQVFTYAQSLTYKYNKAYPIKGILLTHGSSGNHYSFPTSIGIFDVYTEAIDIREDENTIKHAIKKILSKCL